MATKAELTEKFNTLKSELDSITARTGCPKGYLPLHKLIGEIASDITINTLHVIMIVKNVNNKMYATAGGAHIIGCTGYNVKSAKAAVTRFIKESRSVGDNYFIHPSGKQFTVK